MRARLALAQALPATAAAFDLDEPSDGLDPEGIHEMRQTILRLHKELGLTILLSSHSERSGTALHADCGVEPGAEGILRGRWRTQTRDQWVRLEVADFGKAVLQICRERSDHGGRDGNLGPSTKGAGTDQIRAAGW